MGGNSYSLVSTSNVGMNVGQNLHTTSADVRIGLAEWRAENMSINPKVSFYFLEPPTKFFSGREKILSHLHGTLERCFSNTSWEDRIVILYGLGGIGKTEIARKYAVNLKQLKIGSKINNVACFNARNRTLLAESFDLFATLHLPHLKKDENKQRLPDQVYNYFAQNKIRSLLIFDNAQQMQNNHGNDLGIRDFLPTRDLPHDYRPLIMITSRHNNWDVPPENIIHVGELCEAEGRDVIRKPLQEKLRGRDLRPDEESELQKLADLHRGYPLPLSLAVSKILKGSSERNIFPHKINSYIEGIMNDPSGDWIRNEHTSSENSSYQSTMEQVWEETMDRIKSAGRADDVATRTMRLFCLMAYVNPKVITEKGMLSLFNYSLSFQVTQNDIQTYLHELHENALVAYEDKTESTTFWIRINELVQRCKRESMYRGEDFLDYFKFHHRHDIHA